MSRYARALAACVIALGVSPGYAAKVQGTAPDQDTIGMIGQQHVTVTDVIAQDPTSFESLQNDYERAQHELQLKLDQAHHDLLQRQLDKLLDRRALELEAKTRGVGTEVVLAELPVEVVTDDEARAFYDSHRDRIAQPYEAVSAQVRQFLVAQRTESATRRFYDDLRAKHGISSQLTPYRVSVAAAGPVRGQSGAPVTIIEFADYQCPYCKQAESLLRTLLTRHPQEVRIVFRNLPLTQLHPNATVAAEAALCADRQGKFWDMHDAMYNDQSALALDSLKQTAGRLGMNADLFAACLTEASTAQALDLDAKAAQQLGLNSTPYFFINGRPVDGSVPLEKFESIIADELHRASADRG